MNMQAHIALIIKRLVKLKSQIRLLKNAKRGELLFEPNWTHTTFITSILFLSENRTVDFFHCYIFAK